MTAQPRQRRISEPAGGPAGFYHLGWRDAMGRVASHLIPLQTGAGPDWDPWHWEPGECQRMLARIVGEIGAENLVQQWAEPTASAGRRPAARRPRAAERRPRRVAPSGQRMGAVAQIREAAQYSGWSEHSEIRDSKTWMVLTRSGQVVRIQTARNGKGDAVKVAILPKPDVGHVRLTAANKHLAVVRFLQTGQLPDSSQEAKWDRSGTSQKN